MPAMHSFVAQRAAVASCRQAQTMSSAYQPTDKPHTTQIAATVQPGIHSRLPRANRMYWRRFPQSTTTKESNRQPTARSELNKLNVHRRAYRSVPLKREKPADIERDQCAWDRRSKRAFAGRREYRVLVDRILRKSLLETNSDR